MKKLTVKNSQKNAKNGKQNPLVRYGFCSVCGSKLVNKGINLACERCPFVNYRNPRPTTGAFILNGRRILLTKRAREPFKGWWDLPGGFVERGENPQKTIFREIKEETGLSAKVERLFGIYPGTYPAKFDPFHILNIVYVLRVDSVKAGAYDDVSESKWFDVRRLPKLAFDSQENALRDFKKLYKHLWK